MNRLKELRQERKLTQDELCKNLVEFYENDTSFKPISKMNISNWENGKHEIKPDKAEKLAKYFGVTVPYLLGYESSDFGRRLKELREINYLTIERASKELNIPTELWKDFETRDNFVPREKLASQIAHYFGVDVDFLLGKSTILNKKEFQSIEPDSYTPTDEEVENAVYVAYNYGKTLYKNVTDNSKSEIR